MPEQKIKGSVVVITGASSGIGLACAEVFAREGASLAIAARNQQRLEAVAKDLTERFHVPVLPVVTDVSKEAECRNLIEKTVERFGQIDILLNNAGISMRALFKDVSLDVLRKVMDINFWGTVYCTKFALPYILKSGGTIAGMSSIAGFRGLPGRTGYSASKFAMQGFLEALRSETLESGINVMIICPGFTTSNIRNVALNHEGKPQQESPREEEKLMPAETVAEHTLKAIKKRKRTLILTTQGKLTVFFNKWLPGWMDKMTYRHFKKEKNAPF